MQVDQLSKNGYKITDVFDKKLLEELITLVDTFSSEDIRVGATPNTYRQVYHIPRLLHKQIIDKLSFFNIKTASAIELWRDYPGYENHFHYDDYDLVQNIVIVYLDGSGQRDMGTGYVEDQTYTIDYEKNSGLVLFNSNKILHGMNGAVNNVDYRKVIYINWITGDN